MPASLKRRVICSVCSFMCQDCCFCCCSPACERIGHAILAIAYLSLSIGLVVFMIKEVFVPNDAPWEAICVAQVRTSWSFHASCIPCIMHAAWSWGVSSRPSLPVKQVVRHRRCVFAVGQVVEKGIYIFALGQKVVGIVAIGQLAMGLVSVGQAGIGLFFSAVSSAHTLMRPCNIPRRLTLTDNTGRCVVAFWVMVVCAVHGGRKSRRHLLYGGPWCCGQRTGKSTLNCFSASAYRDEVLTVIIFVTACAGR